MDQDLRLTISQLLADMGATNSPNDASYSIILLGISLLLAFTSYFLVKRIVVKGVHLITQRSKVTWDDTFVHHKVFAKLALLTPILVLIILLPLFAAPYPLLTELFGRLLNATLAILLLRAANAVLNAVNEMADGNSLSQRLPITSFTQLVKLFLFFVTLIITIAILSDESPIYLLSGLGVATGFIMLIFKDTILGFVAGIQLATNRMVSKGDWIQMDKYGADGAVEEVTLTTVKVRNWDKTITMIPAYALVSDAFKNWRGMSESGGRRIKRSVYIDAQTIHFLTSDEQTRLARINCLKDYLAEKHTEIDAYNTKINNADMPVNSRNLTNIGTFRAYLLHYLRSHEKVRKDMTLLVRQLAPTTTGVPIELYIFTDETRWAYYEDIQADIFDHIFAILPEFGLGLFQLPSGTDLNKLTVTEIVRE